MGATKIQTSGEGSPETIMSGYEAVEKIKSHNLTPICTFGADPPLSLGAIGAVAILGLMLSMAWVVINERHKRRIRRRF